MKILRNSEEQMNEDSKILDNLIDNYNNLLVSENFEIMLKTIFKLKKNNF